MCVLLEDLGEEVFGHRGVVFSFALELQGFEDVELAAEEHEAIDIHFGEGVGHVVEGEGSLVLVFNAEFAVMVEDDFELVVVEVHHLKGLLKHYFLLLQGELAKDLFVLA